MRLSSIQIENYRSIVKTQSLRLDESYTVIIGANNEGKSNLLRAIVLAMDCLSAFKNVSHLARARLSHDGSIRLDNSLYEWDVDFPHQLQKKHPHGHTLLTLDFELTDAEQDAFREQCGVAVNDSLPVEIRIGAAGGHFKVKKPGRGSASYKKNSIKIGRFISSHFVFEYIPAIRPGRMSLEIVNSLLAREMAILSDDAEFKKAIDKIEELRKPIYARLGASVQEQLKKLLPSVKKVSISLESESFDRRRYSLRSEDFIIDDGTATPLDAKGDGIKSLAAISLMRASRVSKQAGNLVVAIEEPECHLHPGATRELVNVLKELAKEHQVIVTTHSPLLVSRDKLEANVIVSKSKATPATSIKALRDCLGVKVSDALTTAQYVVLVEGSSDAEALGAIFSDQSADFRALLSSGKVIFDQLDGSGNVAYKISNLKQLLANPILLVDDDKAGRQCLKKAKDEAKLEDKFLFLWRRNSGAVTTELEDLIDPNIYWSELQSNLGVTLDRVAFDSSSEQWTVRIKGVYEAGGKQWTSSVESNAKKTIASCVKKSPSNAVLGTHATLVTSVITAIVSLMKPGGGSV